VALTSSCVKRRRKEETQMMASLQTVSARADIAVPVTHKSMQHGKGLPLSLI